jgi:hypothetical protein
MTIAKFFDILIHVILAIIWGGFCGYASHMGITYGGTLGMTMAVFGVLALFAGLLFWPVREKAQHGKKWGGLQSQLEWICPNAAMVAAFGLMFMWVPDRW